MARQLDEVATDTFVLLMEACETLREMRDLKEHKMKKPPQQFVRKRKCAARKKKKKKKNNKKPPPAMTDTEIDNLLAMGDIMISKWNKSQ